MRTSHIATSLSLFLLLMLAACSKKYSWYQTTLVTVNTPNGPKSGSGTVKIQLAVTQKSPPTGGPLGWQFVGEGAVVDLGDGKFVFALLTRPKGGWQPDVVLRVAFQRAGIAPYLRRNNAREWHQKTTAYNEALELVPEEYPTLVAFKDISKPSTIVELKSDSDFEMVFGPGYGVSGIELKISSESEMNRKVSEVLPWLPDWPGAFSNFGKPCATACRGEGQYQPDPPFGDLINRLHFMRYRQ